MNQVQHNQSSPTLDEKKQGVIISPDGASHFHHICLPSRYSNDRNTFDKSFILTHDSSCLKKWRRHSMKDLRDRLTWNTRTLHKNRANWIPNDIVKYCQSCNWNFGAIVWKHHCWECGWVVCGACSSNTDYASGYGDIKVRICDHCDEAWNMRNYNTKEIRKASVFSTYFDEQIKKIMEDEEN